MATRTISTRLVLEGEAEYRAQLKNVNSELALQRSELAKVESQYRASANSMEALSAKGTALQAVYDAQKTKLDLYSSRLESAKAAEASFANQAEESRTKLAEYQSQLAALQQTTGAAAEEKEKLAAQIEAENKTLETAESMQQKAANSAAYYQKQVNQAQVSLDDLNEELSQNRKYLEEAAQSADGCATSIDRYGKSAEQTKSAVDSLATALAAAGAAATLREIAEAIWSCVDASIAFESAITGVNKTVEGTPEQLQAISDGIKEMTTEIPATTTEIAAVAEAAGQLGIATDDVLAFTRVMIDLGESTNLSAEEAATALAQFANIAGTSAADYERLGSVIVGLGNNFATTEAEITEMATRLASAGSLAGLTESEILALAAAMSSVGIEAEAGGTAMTQTLAAMEKAVANGGTSLEQFAEISNMSASEFAAAWGNSPIAAIQAFISGLGGLEEKGESAVLVLEEMGLSGVRQSNMLQSLALASDQMTGAVRLANQAWTENTSLAEEAGKRYATTESKLAMTANAANNVKIAIGDVLSPALGVLAEAGTGAFSWAADFIEENPWLVSAITAVTAGLAALTVGVTAFTAATTIGTAAIKAFQLALSATPIGAVSLAIGALVGVVTAFASSAKDASEASDEFRESLEETKAALEENVATAEESAQNLSSVAESVLQLAGAEEESAFQQKAMLELIDQLNQAIPGLNLAYDEQTGKLNMTADALRNAAEAEGEHLIQAAAIQTYNDLLTQQAAIAAELQSAEVELEKARAANSAEQERETVNGREVIRVNTELAEAQGEAASTVAELQSRYDALQEELAALQGEYGDLTDAQGENSESAVDSTENLADLQSALEDVTDSARAFSDAEDTLSSALQEQTENGTLSLSTTLDLIDAGYAAAFAINEETGAVTINKDAYIAITQAKLDAQIATLKTQKASVDAALAMQDEALMATELGRSYYSAAEAKEALEGQTKSYEAQIAALDHLKGSLNSYSFTYTSTVRTTASVSKRVQTQAEQDLEAYKELKAKLDHEQAMDLIGEQAYYAKLKEYRDQYLTDEDNLDEYRSVTEKIYQYDQSLAERESKLWEEQTEALADELQNRVDTILEQQEKMEDRLSGYGDLFSVEEDQLALESIQSQIDAINDYEAAITSLRDRGLSDGLLNEVLSMDVDEATAYAQQLLDMTDEQWNEYNELWEEKQRRAIEVAQQFYQDQLDTLKTEYDDKLAQALSDLTDTSYVSGQDTAQGLIDGLKSRESALYQQAQAMADRVSEILSSVSTQDVRVDGSHAGGLPYVPYDGYIAQLHQGERVLTAEEARAYIARSMPNNLELPKEVNQTQTMGRMLSQAVNAMTENRTNTGNGDLYIDIPINGTTFCRAILRDFRTVSKANPEVQSGL